MFEIYKNLKYKIDNRLNPPMISKASRIEKKEYQIVEKLNASE